ncbi:acyl CoA binding protein-domain-containing protein [Filobasidium floriforme]|uniref:acyl CoA binding protein-domain-containing protein n=1 Tax=Filobasidium floriforme TaxID=5210 RepID=UPI001E8E0AE1|nr:acyl CoA binding protein-domain-containing protein [Filobasidium floriforme]KAH8090706.1 acyl CoA binding protein-domain-containing protein [Filobasidium floriforme]
MGNPSDLYTSLRDKTCGTMDEGTIERQFFRAVDIVQSLPKNGPIQSSYDDKLAIYSLFKQATEGDRPGGRPGLFDVLGRAKWDAWNKQRGSSKQDAMVGVEQRRRDGRQIDRFVTIPAAGCLRRRLDQALVQIPKRIRNSTVH